MKLLSRTRSKKVPNSIEWSKNSKNYHPNNESDLKAGGDGLESKASGPASNAPTSDAVLQKKKGMSLRNLMSSPKSKKNKKSVRKVKTQPIAEEEKLETPKEEEKKETPEEEETVVEVKPAVVDEEKQEVEAPAEKEEAPAKEENAAPVAEELEEPAPASEEEAAPMEGEEEEAAATEASPAEETPEVETSPEETSSPFLAEPDEVKDEESQSDSYAATTYETDISYEPSIEAVEQDDAVLLGYYQPPLPEQDASVFEEAYKNLWSMWDGAVGQAKVLGAQGTELLNCAGNGNDAEENKIDVAVVENNAETVTTAEIKQPISAAPSAADVEATDLSPVEETRNDSAEVDPALDVEEVRQ